MRAVWVSHTQNGSLVLLAPSTLLYLELPSVYSWQESWKAWRQSVVINPLFGLAFVARFILWCSHWFKNWSLRGPIPCPCQNTFKHFVHLQESRSQGQNVIVVVWCPRLQIYERGRHWQSLCGPILSPQTNWQDRSHSDYRYTMSEVKCQHCDNLLWMGGSVSEIWRGLSCISLI